MSNLLHLRQRERERLQERRDQVYDELQRLYAQMDQAEQRAQGLEQEFAELQRRIGDLEVRSQRCCRRGSRLPNAAWSAATRAPRSRQS